LKRRILLKATAQDYEKSHLAGEGRPLLAILVPGGPRKRKKAVPLAVRGDSGKAYELSQRTGGRPAHRRGRRTALWKQDLLREGVDHGDTVLVPNKILFTCLLFCINSLK